MAPPRKLAHRRAHVLATLVAALTLALGAASSGSAHELQTPAFYPMPVGSIKAAGWLNEQLMIQYQGLAGNLGRFYVDIVNSTWIGGDATENNGAPALLRHAPLPRSKLVQSSDSAAIFPGLHERLPYFINGIVPMLFQLDVGPSDFAAAGLPPPRAVPALAAMTATATARRLLIADSGAAQSAGVSVGLSADSVSAPVADAACGDSAFDVTDPEHLTRDTTGRSWARAAAVAGATRGGDVRGHYKPTAADTAKAFAERPHAHAHGHGGGHAPSESASAASAAACPHSRQRAPAVVSDPSADMSADPSYSLHRHVAQILRSILDLQAATPSGWLGGAANDDPSDADQYWIGWDVVYSMLHFAEGSPPAAAELRAGVMKYMREALRRMHATPMAGWSAVRWPEWAHVAHYILDTVRGLSADDRAVLLEVGALAQAQGFDWVAYFSPDPLVSPSFLADGVPFARGWTLTEHGVNNAMALKDGAVMWRQSGNESFLSSSHTKLSLLTEHHGMPSGAFSADECFGGREPTRGVELCTIVETAFSLNVMARYQGEGTFADRAERLAYNALPGGLTEDMWSHNYVSQSNEIFSGWIDPHPWVTNPPSANIYGLAPTYGCCTVNHIQGWPKFVQAAVGFALSPAPAAVVSLWAPVSATLPAEVGGGARVVVDTEYPFSDTASVSITAVRPMDVLLRVPDWATEAVVSGNGMDGQRMAPAGGFFRTTVPEGKTTLTVDFKPQVRVEVGWGGKVPGVSVFRGPVLFALPLTEEYKVTQTYPGGAKDLEVSSEAAWNFALLINDLSNAQASFQVHRSAPQGTRPFASASPRVWLTAKARRVPGWTGDATTGNRTASVESMPRSPACGPDAAPSEAEAAEAGSAAAGAGACGEVETVRLVPFGNTRLRVAVLPYTNN